jgi:DNA-binding CsgD family transcriptional regulator
MRLRKKNGEYIWILAKAKVTEWDNDGNPIRVVGTNSDISERKRAESEIQRRKYELECQKQSLESANTALRVLLQQQEEIKRDIEDNFLMQIKDLVKPCLYRIRNSNITDEMRKIVEITESRLNDVLEPFARRLSSPLFGLSSREIEIASMIRDGLTSKEIAQLLYVSTRTVNFHRENIRRKLKLKNKAQSLKSTLRSMS